MKVGVEVEVGAPEAVSITMKVEVEAFEAVSIMI